MCGQNSDEVVIHVDAACDTDAKRFGIGSVIGNNEDNMVAAMTNKVSSFVSPLCSEASAILEGLQLAHRMEFQQVHLYSNPLTIVSILNGLVEGVVEVHPIVWDIQ